MKKLISIIIILILIILIILYVWIIVEPVDNEPFYPYDAIKKNLKTGDIILFSSKKHDSFMEKLAYGSRTNLMGTMYGHAAVVLKTSDKIYIVECCPVESGYETAIHLNNKNLGGIRIIELDTALKEYYAKYHGIYAVKFISKEIPNDILIDKLLRYKNVIFQNADAVRVLAVVDILISHKLATTISKSFDKERMICTEFVYQILYDCGVLHYYPSKLVWPHFFTSKKFDSLQKIQYSKPYKFSVITTKNNNTTKM